MTNHDTGSPFAPHTPSETAAMLAAVGVDSEEELFDIPEDVLFDGEFGITRQSEQSVIEETAELLGENDDLTEFLGRGHYDHYVPSWVDHIADRSEFLTSYTQYQPEIAQGFLQALFEYQSILVELTGLPVANCSMYDAATALGEAATLTSRVRAATGETVLVPELLDARRRDVVENYVSGTELNVESYPMDDGNADLTALERRMDEDVALLYAETPTVRGTIEEQLSELGRLAHAADALFCLGTDIVALALLEEPASVGADIVVGEAGSLGLPMSYGMGLGLFACRERFLRQVPGRLVGASNDATDRRAYTLTLQTREQHIRRERATSNICTNQAWVALRTAMCIASHGPDGLVELANDCVTGARELADGLDAIDGVTAPVHDRHHFREFIARVRDAPDVRKRLETRGFAVHAIDDHHLQVCTTETNADERDRLCTAMEEVV
ncbi:aminomethyl-transferring glycine dehydrogenase subunit GcvPA [Halocatena salina]|uniref:glycine dehydrogenase (aminomethyl-transferring) n=1 Tax=Halocatena salina TaxID=2934340 RepID=A0A8U0A7Z5_9EURY|nr:aminomethyl-transferring glycine dehydrogenase subunit GcvPA [Halocatena salina]UPM44153.1 aminomethyl-transferring glycine dehydrogenase subunit GcvPA [Halocatena salina]